MPYHEFVWTGKAVRHLAEHGATTEDFEHVVLASNDIGVSQTSGSPAAWGYTIDGRDLIAVFEEIDDVRLLPVTAYEVHERRRLR